MAKNFYEDAYELEEYAAFEQDEYGEYAGYLASLANYPYAMTEEFQQEFEKEFYRILNDYRENYEITEEEVTFKQKMRVLTEKQ